MVCNEQVRKPPRSYPHIAGFDLNAKPTGLDDPVRRRRARRLGAARWAQAEEAFPGYLHQEKLDREFLRAVTHLGGSAARSGEDLPALRRGQLQIAGFCNTYTTHCECWSLRAYEGVSRIRYEFVDEMDHEKVNGPRLALLSTLTWPTLGKLIWMIDHSAYSDCAPSLYFSMLVCLVVEQGDNPSDLVEHIRVYSEFYPELSRWYRTAVRLWAQELNDGRAIEEVVDSIALMARHSGESGNE